MDRNSKFMNITSPYSKHYKPRLRADQNELLTKRLGASKLTRKELENKYYDLCEENVIVKRENNENKEKIKHLTTKLLRLSSCSGRSIKPRELFSTDDTLKVRLIDLENKNSILKDQMKSLITKYGKRIKDFPIFSPNTFDTNRYENMDNMDTKRDEKSIVSSTRKSEISLETPYSMRGSSAETKSEVHDDEETDRNTQEENDEKEQEESLKKQSHFIENLQDEINTLNSYLDESRQVNNDLLKEISELRAKWTEIDLSKKLADDIKVIELNRCLEEAKQEILRQNRFREDKERETCCQINRERELAFELEEKLKAMSDKSLEDTAKLERAQHEHKQLDELENVIKQKNLEIETLRDQSNKFQAIVNSSEEDVIKLKELTELNEELKRQVENGASSSSSLEHSQANLLEKVKILQIHNDELIVELEGKKNENSFLKQKNEELEIELIKLKKLYLELEKTKNVLCQRINEYRKKSDINNLTINETQAWSNKFQQISETVSPLVDNGTGDVCIPADYDYEIPVRKIISDPKVSFYSRNAYQKYSHKSTYRYENIGQIMQNKSSLQIFESPKIKMERDRNTRRALKFYRYYHSFKNSSTKVPVIGDEGDYTNTDNFSDLSSIRHDECTDETIQENLPDSLLEEISMSDQNTIMSLSCETGNDRNLVNFKVKSLDFVDKSSYNNIEIEFINKVDRKSMRFSLDSTKLQQQIYLDDKNKLNFLLIFSELNNRNEFGFSIFQNEIEENLGGKMDLELDVYDICFPHKILGKLFINIFL